MKKFILSLLITLFSTCLIGCVTTGIKCYGVCLNSIKAGKTTSCEVENKGKEAKMKKVCFKVRLLCKNGRAVYSMRTCEHLNAGESTLARVEWKEEEVSRCDAVKKVSVIKEEKQKRQFGQ